MHVGEVLNLLDIGNHELRKIAKRKVLGLQILPIPGRDHALNLITLQRKRFRVRRIHTVYINRLILSTH